MRTPAKEALEALLPASLRTASCTQKLLPSGGSGGSPSGFQGRAGREGSGAGPGSLSLSLLFSNRRRDSARGRRGRLPGWLRLCPYPHARGGSAPCRLRAQVVPRGLDPCDSPAAPGHARTSRLARCKPVSRRRDLLPRAPRATPSPPDWPPTPCALRPSPFPHPVLHGLPGLARALLFPAYWALDQLLGCWAPAARPSDPIWLSAAAGAGAALLLWLLLQAWRRPFCYQPPPQCGAPPTPWRPPTEPARSFSFFSANLCLLPDGLARFSNLPHSQRRAETVGAVLLAGLRHSPYGATGCSSPVQGMPCGVLIGAMPASLDFTCLQEVFDLRAERRLVSRLAPNLGPVSYDVGTFGLQPGLHLKLLGSGLLLASRYPLLRAVLPHARREDALASKGLLSAQRTGSCAANS
ncbi:sphingomyelin phosphodiesterase 5-like [Eubalaena glacialis]|uniref:sphingomyelin phosphodiesterase 5-like n=1 Tax=Eubalaena glacialis TaxID=27606 RepID=UPI002A59E861|nr:sphingomyelin phosphodiesterase 5-like [Eubalaena glacialis]